MSSYTNGKDCRNQRGQDYLRLGVNWNINESCPACDVKYSSLHQRTPIKRVINIELFFIVSLIEIEIRKVFNLIYLFIFKFLIF